MTWQPEIDELRKREELRRRMGGAEKIKRQQDGGKLTVRERVASILDPRDTRRLLCEFADLAALLRTPGRSAFGMRP